MVDVILAHVREHGGELFIDEKNLLHYTGPKLDEWLDLLIRSYVNSLRAALLEREAAR